MKTTVWIVDREDGLFACANDLGFWWTENVVDAIWFTRRSDAEQIAAILGDDANGIIEHTVDTKRPNVELMASWGPETKLDRIHRARAFLYLQDVLTEAENNRVKIRIKKKYGEKE